MTKERLSFQDVKRKSEVLSTIFVERYGLKAGDTVSIFAANTVWYAVGLWATVRVGECLCLSSLSVELTIVVGGRINGASPAYTVDEVVYALKTVGTRILLTTPSSLPVILKAAERVALDPSRILLLEGQADGIISLQALLDTFPTHAHIVPHARIPPNQTNDQVCAYLNFSSGTTGLPKAVQLSHHNIIAQCWQLRQLQLLSPPRPVSAKHRHGLPEYRILAVMPLFHITGLIRFIHYPVFMNGLSAMLPKYTLLSMISAIVEYDIHELILVPPILLRIVNDPAVEPRLPDLSRVVKRWSSGSAPIAPEVIAKLKIMFPDTGFRQGYGATESSACISAHPSSHFDYRYAHTGGLLVANTTVKVIALPDPSSSAADGGGEQERLLRPGQVGEICARGPQIALLGYLNNPAATRETFDNDGYLHTGDVGYLDEEGLVHILDRLKEMIKVKGQQVAPAEIEDLLLGRDEVEDVAVIGVKDLDSGERVKAFVVLKPSLVDQPTESMEDIARGLMQYVCERTVRYKWLCEVEIVPEVPKSATGKLLRRVLRDWELDASRKRGHVCKEPDRARVAKRMAKL